MSDFLQPNGSILLLSQPEEPTNPDPTTPFGVRRTDASTDPLADISMFAGGTGNLQGIIALSTMNSGTSTGALVERMRVHTNGLVGIGTQAPTAALEVAGTVKATAFEGSGAALTGISDASRVSKAGDTMTGALGIGTTSPAALLDVNGSARCTALTVNGNATVVGTLGVTAGANLATSSGNVGIGTASPGSKLDVSGTARVTGGTNLATSSGNVGIGTTSPTSKLHVVGAVNASSTLTIGGNLNLASTTTVYLGSGRRIIHQWANNELWLNQGAAGAEYTGGVHVSGKLYCPDGLQVSGTKQFGIPHPLDPDNRDLVHACIEGPEAAVYYRGEARLVDGVVTIELPRYFEALTRREGRTVLVTPLLEKGAERTSALAASRVEDGRFEVRAIDVGNRSQAFCWEVKAVRADVEPFDVEPERKPATG